MANFEEQLRALENVVERLEQGDIPLEESVKLFEQGLKLSNACKKELEAAEGKIEILVKQSNGEMKPVAMNLGKDAEREEAEEEEE
jgi:exodeoxyribonuclease VII small subunit